MNKAQTLWDKVLPNQTNNNHYYRGNSDHYYRALYELVMRTGAIRPPEDSFKLTLSEKVTIEEMASNPIQLRLLEFLVKLTGARHILEIGAFIGLSAMTMARAMPPGGVLTTIEKFEHFAEICRRNFAANGLKDRIHLLEGDAFQVIDTLPKDQQFDLVFIDGNKERYANYMQAVEKRVRKGGLILVDDVLFHGDVLNEPPLTEKGAGVKAFLNLAEGKSEYLRLMLPFSNGLMLMLKQ